MNAVFTIVAKNFLARAHTLGDSIKLTNPEIDYYVFLCDETEGLLDLSREKHRVIEAKNLAMPRYREMGFKYSLLEFACAIKPFCFEYLFQKYAYEKIIYFDPDIYVYGDLNAILDLLSKPFMVITPHLLDLDLTTEGAMPEASFLFVGAYNLGFIALRQCEQVSRFLKWWQCKLEDQGFADCMDALHVDQKWMDLIPGLLGDGVLISRNPGLNMAQWNIHERRLGVREGKLYANDQPLVFFHFASFDPLSPFRLATRQTKFNLGNKPEFQTMAESYAQHLLCNKYSEYLTLPYVFSKFDNGVNIFVFQRRLYRKLVEQRKISSDPFSTSHGSFYDLLRKNGLVVLEKSKSEFVQRDFSSSGRWVKWMLRLMEMAKNVFGIKYYYLWIRWLFGHTRPEEQLFLIHRGLDELE